MSESIVAFAGSRFLSPESCLLVGRVAGTVVKTRRSLSVGCCIGADAAVLSAPNLRVGMIHCFSAFGPGGEGGDRSVSAIFTVSAFVSNGGEVYWLAGGPLSVPFRERLAARTAAVVGAATDACVVFFSTPKSPGTTLAASIAASRGLPLFAFPCGISPKQLPIVSAGSWKQVGGSGIWAQSFRWSPDQSVLI